MLAGGAEEREGAGEAAGPEAARGSRTQLGCGFLAGLVLGWAVWTAAVARHPEAAGGVPMGALWIVGVALVVAVWAHSRGDRFWRRDILLWRWWWW